MLSLVEAVLENPGVVLAAQLDRLRADTVARLKREGVEYEERMAILDRLEHPKPLRDFTYDLFNAYAARHPWVVDHTIRPKSVARELYERSMTFTDYVGHYGLARSEGLVLRYLSDAYKGLVQNVPEDAKTEEVFDLTEWLGETVRQVDSSLLDEWERLRHPVDDDADGTADDGAGPATGRRAAPGPAGPPGVTANERAFRVMVRNELFRLGGAARPAGLRRPGGPAAGRRLDGGGAGRRRWPATGTDHDGLGTGPAARGPDLFTVTAGPWAWDVRQALDDPAGDRDWALSARVDLAASDEEGRPVLALLAVGAT